MINIVHFIHVRVVIPWAFDPKHEAEFVLLPNPTTQIPDLPISTESSLFRTLRNAETERKLGKIDYWIENCCVVPGQSVQVKLKFAPKNQGEIYQVVATLTGKENVGPNKDATDLQINIYRHKTEISNKTDFFANNIVEFSGLLEIPAFFGCSSITAQIPATPYVALLLPAM